MPRRRYIVKVDGSFHRNKESGIGVVVIDRYKGRYFYNIQTKCKTSHDCERMAIMYALYKLKELNINSDVVVLCDNHDVIRNFANKYQTEHIVFSWIPRSQNRVAHHLAKIAARGQVVKSYVPNEILKIKYK